MPPRPISESDLVGADPAAQRAGIAGAQPSTPATSAAGAAMKSPASSWARSSESTSRRSAASPPQAPSRKPLALAGRHARAPRGRARSTPRYSFGFIARRSARETARRAPGSSRAARCPRRRPARAPPPRGSGRRKSAARRRGSCARSSASRLFSASSSATRSTLSAAGAARRLGQRDVHLAAAALCATARPRDVDQDAAHDLRRHAEEMCAVLPLHILPVDQPHVGLVDERGRLQDVPGTLARHLAARPAGAARAGPAASAPRGRPRRRRSRRPAAG